MTTINNNICLKLREIHNDSNTLTNNQFIEEVLRDVVSGEFDKYLTGNFSNNTDESIETEETITNGQKHDEGSDDDDEPNEYDSIEDMMQIGTTNLVVQHEFVIVKYFTCSFCNLISEKAGRMIIDECGHEFCNECLESFFYHENFDCLVKDCDGTLSEQNIRLLFQLMRVEMRKVKENKKRNIEATYVLVSQEEQFTQMKDERSMYKKVEGLMHNITERLMPKKEEVDGQTVICTEKESICLDGFVDDLPIISNLNKFECKICFTECEPYEGIILRACLHLFCLDCMRQFLKNDENVIFECPNIDNDIKCDGILEEREIRSILPKNEFRTYMKRLIKFNVQTVKGSVQCCETNCTGIAITDEGDANFYCPKCMANNCLTCKAIHDNMTCDDYKISIDPHLKLNVKYLKKRKADGFAMDCPCGAIVEKVDGCDGMKCPICNIDLCWATKGRRWGPGGKGDTSAGCRCGLLFRCHPSCQNCH